ncbi:MAG TPA: hypothetical protein VD763_00820 [Candidatus Saccharimonadales bacterium]|nr:hypothetical protein [Candidatus Saccharimonadales bacterium]
MTPLFLVAAGALALGIGVLVLRTYGPSYRVGRLLSATPTVTLAEAIAYAAGPPRYVAVRGRIDAEEDFEDDAHRPLVLRRARLQLRRGRVWETVDEHVESVPFELHEGLDTLAIDVPSLKEGLVVVPRESVGTAADAMDRLPAGTMPDRPLRLRVEQVSSVEHAIALGVPVAEPDGSVRLTAGLGRPLILTTLEHDEAMRVLTGGDTGRPLAAAVALGAGLLLLVVGLAWAALGAVTATALAASPTPTSGGGGDPRSSGQGPGLVGDPLLAIGLVVLIGVVAMLATLGYVRLTGGRRA